MVDFPRFLYSKREVERISSALKEQLSYSEENEDYVQHVFKVANNWRDSHLYPMVRMRHVLIGQMRRQRLVGITAARVKRMHSIRKKLRKIKIGLRDIQDLGGARAILSSMNEVDRLTRSVLDNFPHKLSKVDDYITNPKLGGYRSRHLIYKYAGFEDDEHYDGRIIEIQLRSRLQHSWATAVEAVGLVLGQDLKGGLGDENWLRLFDLMSSELALAEKSPEVPNAPCRNDRRKELVELDKLLNAASTLENLRQIFHYTDNYYSPHRGRYYLIRYMKDSGDVIIKDYGDAVSATSAYATAEESASKSTYKENVVLVEVDKLDNLKQAYPNYYGDVRVFSQNLRAIVSGKDAKEYKMPPQERVAPRMRDVPDVSWFRRHSRQPSRN